MSERIIDLRSDTVTKPTAAMREVIARAVVGDDVLGDDPTTKELESRMASLLGMEAALFVPSGTMANTLALLSQTQPGNEIILDRNCHIFNYEAGGASAIGGLQIFPLDGQGGLLPIDQLPQAVRPDNVHHPRTSLIAVENTHNRAGGRIYPFDQLKTVFSFARERGLRLHLDGARLINASVQTTISLERYGALADSVTFCFSKGLGAPIGSVLISDRETIDRAFKWRKRLGGGMRQVGILAAACLYALDNNVQRIVEDHEKAAKLGEIVESSSLLRLRFPVETNIVIFEVVDESRDIEELRAAFEREGVLLLAFGGRFMRMVTHLDISSDDIERVEKIFEAVLSA